MSILTRLYDKFFPQDTATFDQVMYDETMRRLDEAEIAQAEDAEIVANDTTDKKGVSTVTFTIDDDLKVTPETHITEKGKMIMIEEGFLDMPTSQNDAAVNLGALLIVAEVCDQIIDSVNEQGV